MPWSFASRSCVRCGKPIPSDKQSSARFDTSPCKVHWGRARQHTRTSAELAAFEQRIERLKDVATYYRLAIRIAGQAWTYPITKKPSLRFDGLERSTPGFLIDPYEPPVVPIAGEYYLLLSDEDGERIQLPRGEEVLAALVPCRPIDVKSGERGR